MLEIELYDNNSTSIQYQRPTECYTQDPSGYEKCVSMCQKSIENLVSLLEEEEAAEARRRPKVVMTSILYLYYLRLHLYLYYIYLHIYTRW